MNWHWFRPANGNEDAMSRRQKKKQQRDEARAAVDHLKKMVSQPQPEPEVKNAILLHPVTHSVSLVKDVKQDYPQIYLEVFFSVGGHEKAYGEMWARSGCSRAASLETADLVVFPGGLDVDPSIYSVKPAHHLTKFDRERDDIEMAVYAQALKLGVPMLGICRGAQFLWVMQGGDLYQHCDGHNGSHLLVDTRTGETIDRISSTHHQMVKPTPNVTAEILGIAPGVSNYRYSEALVAEHDKEDDIEAYFCPETCCLGIQGHPEYRGYSRYSKWVLSLIEDRIMGNPNVQSVRVGGHGNYRFQPPKQLTINGGDLSAD